MGLTTAQVQTAWLKEANANPPDDFPGHALELRDDLETIANNLHDRFPRLRLCYLSSRTYGGYAKTPLNPEPQAYESGFSVKWLIEDQIDAGAAGQRIEPLDHVLGPIVDQLVGALAAGELGLLGRAHCAVDSHAGVLGELDRGRADAAGGALDQHALGIEAAGAFKQ